MPVTPAQQGAAEPRRVRHHGRAGHSNAPHFAEYQRKGRKAAASSERVEGSGVAPGAHGQPECQGHCCLTRLTADTSASCLLSCISEVFHNKFVKITTMGQVGLQESVQKGQNSRHTVNEQHTPHSPRAPAARPGQAWTSLSHSWTAGDAAGPAPRDGNK